jgi:O-phosphoseryl-tRNA(Cys) synthetase
MIEKNRNKSGGCSCSPGCCGSISEISNAKKQIKIDFLYLDLSVCTRCQGTDTNLDEALNEVARVLEATGTEVLVNKINVNTAEMAEIYKFVSSPTIRVNGRDIQMEVKESLCESCGDLCGTDVDCRVWIYQGQEYAAPPKAMIIEAILKEVYGGSQEDDPVYQEYVMPANLKNFYAVIRARNRESI